MWQEQSSCWGRDPALWEETRGRPTKLKRYNAGLAICKTCPVILECFAGVMLEELQGSRTMYRAGLSSGQRRTLWRTWFTVGLTKSKGLDT